MAPSLTPPEALPLPLLPPPLLLLLLLSAPLSSPPQRPGPGALLSRRISGVSVIWFGEIDVSCSGRGFAASSFRPSPGGAPTPALALALSCTRIPSRVALRDSTICAPLFVPIATILRTLPCGAMLFELSGRTGRRGTRSTIPPPSPPSPGGLAPPLRERAAFARSVSTSARAISKCVSTSTSTARASS